MRYLYSVLVMLIFGCTHLFATHSVLVVQDSNLIQENDSLNDLEQISPLAGMDNGSIIDSVRARVILYSRQVDSLQNGVDRPVEPDSVDTVFPFVEKLLVDMAFLQTEIDSLKRVYATESNDLDILEVGRTDTIQIQDALNTLGIQLDNAITNAMSVRNYFTDSLVLDTDTLGDSIPVIGELPILEKRIFKQIRSNLNRDRSSVPYFDYYSWSSRILLFALSLIYFYWIYRLGRKSPDSPDELPLPPNEPVWIPLVKSFILFLVLLPFVSLQMPLLVIQYSYLLIFVALLVILYKQLAIYERRLLGFVLGYYVLLLLVNLLVSTDITTRVFAGLINLAGVYLVWKVGNPLETRNSAGHLHRYARWGIILAHILALASNIGGYIDYARVWTSVAGVGLLQIISLKAFRDMLRHDLESQFSNLPKIHTLKNFNAGKVLNSFDKLLKLGSTALVFIILFNILGVIGEVIEVVQRVFNKDHQIGSITFNYADLLLAIFVLWLANWLQKNLKNLLDDTPEGERGVKKMTLFPLFRLAIIIVGFLFAVNILGLGVDKLTVIIGALSVGIGLGLQNIINNFVSGVILVFEKPFKLGDYIEIGDKTGQVMEIGIRSSTLMTDQGAKVIVPNGDLLSGRLVNWTFSNTDIRVNFELVVSSSGQIEEIKKAIRKKLSEQKNVDKTVPIKVHTKDISATDYRLSVQVGISNVRYIERFRSQFLEEIMSEMQSKGVSISSI